MVKSDLKTFVKGWFIGNFEPTLFDTKEFEIAIKRYKSGDKESAHYHRMADEYTVVVSGRVSMNNQTYGEDDIIFIKKGESTDFISLSDSVTCVIKIPCVKDDKFLT
jgi:mannose-6-phosphate isomerase-like protein (cupin superfamily)